MSEIVVAEPGTRLQKFLDRAGLRGFPWKTAIILYTISWGWLFIVRDSLWVDDWFLFVNYDFSIQGFAPWIDIQIKVMRSFGLTFFRSIIYISFLMAAVFLFGVTRQISFLNLSQRRLVVLLFLLLPFNTVRVTLMVYWYTIGYLVFFLAWYLLVGFGSRKSKFAACILFFLSFQMFSLLVFFLLPVSHLFFLEGRGKIRDALGWLRKNLLLILLPVVYWVSRSLFWSTGREYHEVTDNKIIGFLKFLLLVAVFLVVLSLLYRWSKQSYKKPILLLIVGFCVMFVGYLPYVFYGLVGYGFDVPMVYLIVMLGRSDWFSRHQILQPLGFSIVLIGLVGLLPSFMKMFTNQIIAAVLAVSVVFNLAFGFEYVVDYVKQREVVTHLKKNGENESISGFMFIDQTTLLNARGRVYRYRDWQGLVSLAFDSELQYKTDVVIETSCSPQLSSRLVLIQGPETHWKALKNWVIDGDMGFKVTVDDTPGACKPEMVTSERVSGAIPILFYFTGAKN